MSSDKKISFIGTVIWVICALFFTYEFLLRTVLGTFEHPIIQDLDLNLVTFAILSSTAYQVIYGVMQIPVGFIADRFGLKKTLTIAIIICAIAVIGFGFVYTFKSAFVFRIMMGFGSSFGFVCLLIAVYEWMPKKYIGLFIGLSQFIGTLGPMVAAGPLNSLANNSSTPWRYIFYGLGIIGICLGFAVLLIVRNNTRTVDTFRILKRNSSLSTDLKNILFRKQIWYIGIFSALVYFSIEYLSENSGKSFLMLHGYSSDLSSYMITTAWLGYAIGCPVMGMISDLLCRRKKVMIINSLLALTAITIITYFPINVFLAFTGFFLLGLGASGQSIGFAIIAEHCKSSYRAAGLGFNNASIMLVCSSMAPVIGWILSTASKGNELTVDSYKTAFTLMVAAQILSFIISAFLIKETYCKSMKETLVLSVD